MSAAAAASAAVAVAVAAEGRWPAGELKSSGDFCSHTIEFDLRYLNL